MTLLVGHVGSTSARQARVRRAISGSASGMGPPVRFADQRVEVVQSADGHLMHGGDEWREPPPLSNQAGGCGRGGAEGR